MIQTKVEIHWQRAALTSEVRARITSGRRSRGSGRIPTYPGLRCAPSWAKMFSAPTALDFWAACSNARNEREVCRPYGTRHLFPLYPALKRWAKLFLASGAGLVRWQSASCSTTLASGAWFRPLAIGVLFHQHYAHAALTQTPKSGPDTKRSEAGFFRSCEVVP